MMNFIVMLSLAEEISDRQAITTTFADLRTLYALYTSIKTAGHIDIKAMAKAGTLAAEMDALHRTTALLAGILNDKELGPHAIALLEDMSL